MPTSISTSEDRRSQLFALYSPLISAIASSIQFTLPASIQHDDLCSEGNIALLEIAAGMEFYVRTRVRGRMIDSVRGSNYKNSTGISIDDGAAEFAISAPSVVESIDARQKSQRVRAAIQALPEPEQKAVASRLRGERVIEFARREGISKRTAIRRMESAVVGIRAHVTAA